MATYSGDIKGNVTIVRGDDFSKLTSVGGDLSIRAEGAALPVLTSVGGYLYIRAEGAALPVLTSVGGDLSIEAEGAALPVLTSVGGYLYIRAEGAALPVLTSVGGDLYIEAEGAALPVLTSVGGDLSIEAEGAALPVLTSVKGHDLPDAAIARERLINVARQVTAEPDTLDMKLWHNESGGCGTTHCIAGWAVHLAGAEGYELERKVGGTLAAGTILLGVEASSLFFIEKGKALAAMQKLLADEEAAV